MAKKTLMLLGIIILGVGTVVATALQSVAPLKTQMSTKPTPNLNILTEASPLTEKDQTHLLFNTKGSTAPFVETVKYSSRAAWMKGRQAWGVDYARHYKTPIHFIARSFNNSPEYEKIELKEGSLINVYKTDYPLEFYILVDLLKLKLHLYAINIEEKTRFPIKTYPIAAGRINPQKVSGSLTPIGRFQLGNKTAIYKKCNYGTYQGERTEMIRVFGTRWIPFEKEIAGCSAPAKSFGVHGTPWKEDPISGKLQENREESTGYKSDGCIRMTQKDIEEVFAIISSKPTQIEITKDVKSAYVIQAFKE